MLKGILRYNNEDYLKNQWFVNHLIACGSLEGIEILLLFEDLSIEGVSFVINRTRSVEVAKFYENQGIRVFNNSVVTMIGNDKKIMYERFKELQLPCLSMNRNSLFSEYVVKERYGHGGIGVTLSNDVSTIDENKYIVQEYRKMKSDVRIIVLGNEIVVAIKRENTNDFRHNVSLGAKSSLYLITGEMKELVGRLCNEYLFDLVGIDFLIDEKEQLWINEIEDMVGVRSVYQNSAIDIGLLYIKYIRECMND